MGINFKQVTKRLLVPFASSVPEKTDGGRDEAKRIAKLLSNEIDLGGIQIGIVNIPGLRFPEVVVTSGRPAPGQVSLTIICDLTVQQALSEAEMVMTQAYDEWDASFSKHGL